MIRIIALTCVLAVAWAGNWAWGYRDNLDQTVAWFDTAAATHGPASQTGFPNRYDVTLPDVTIADLGFKAEFIQIFRVVYKNDHRIVVFPNNFSIFDTQIQGRNIRASIVQDQAHLPRIVVEGLDLSLANGLTATRGQVSIVPNIGENKYIAYFWLENAAINGNPIAAELKMSAKFKMPLTPPITGLIEIAQAMRQDQTMQITLETEQPEPIHFDLDWPITSPISPPTPGTLGPIVDLVNELIQ